MQALDAQYRVISGGTSDCCSMTAGYRFKFINHPNSDQNGKYVITSVGTKSSKIRRMNQTTQVEQPYNNKFHLYRARRGQCRRFVRLEKLRNRSFTARRRRSSSVRRAKKFLPTNSGASKFSFTGTGTARSMPTVRAGYASRRLGREIIGE